MKDIIKRFQQARFFIICNSAIMIAGLLIFILGLPIPEGTLKELLFSAGCFLLAVGSFFEKEYFFACLEVVLIVAAFLTLFHIGLLISITIILLLNIAVVGILLRTGRITLHVWNGLLGLLLLSGGIVFNTNLLMLLAGVVLAVYAYFSARAGFKVGWIFLFLNFLFIVIAFMNLHAAG
jgi:hypothetical protein